MEIKDSIYSFCGGFVISVFGNISWLGQMNTPVQNLMLEWAAKVMGTLILGIIGGMAGLFAKDLYKFLKDKLK